MVLVCPDCQQDPQWVDELDRCPSCGSSSLTRALGETTCKTCGAVVPSQPDVEAASGAPGLSDEVADALERAFRRPLD
jgi:RNA polymerase subunit RPABC4/transcription elongation factor Spt4